MDRAVISYIHPGVVRAEFMRSMLNTVVAEHERIEAVLSLQSGPLISNARNDAVSMFLTNHKAPWLWMVDTDMVFAANALVRLIEAADPRERPIMGGLCYSDGPEGPLPVLFELVEKEDHAEFARYTVWPEDQPFRVAGTGAACLLMHREALRRIASGWGEKIDRAFPWFRESSIKNRRVLGEDLTFCLRAQTAGIPIYVHTGVQIGHMKSTMLGKVT